MGKTILGLLLGVSLCFGSIQEVIAASQVRITGAFGLNLYDKLDPNIVEIDEEGFSKYFKSNLILGGFSHKHIWEKIKPSISNKMFQSYHVRFTSRSKTIFGITAVGFYLDRDECRWNKVQLRDILNKKYGKMREHGEASYIYVGEKGQVKVICQTPFRPLRNYDKETYFLVIDYSLNDRRTLGVITNDKLEDPDLSGL